MALWTRTTTNITTQINATKNNQALHSVHAKYGWLFVPLAVQHSKAVDKTDLDFLKVDPLEHQ